MNIGKPRTVKELQSALDMWAYFISFILAYFTIAAPLSSQIKKDGTTLVWCEECEKAW